MKRFVSAVASLMIGVAGAAYSPLLLLSPVQAQIFEGFEGCPTGTREGEPNFVRNGDFATLAGTGNGQYTLPAAAPAIVQFESQLPYRGDSVYPNDPVGGISIQTGPYPLSYAGGIVQANSFPGDPAFGIPPINTFLYSNPGERVGGGSAFPNPIIWRQVVTGLSPNTSYAFSAYFYNLLDIGAPGQPPVVRYLAGPPGGIDSAFVPSTNGFPIGDGSAQPGIPASQNVRQRWIRAQAVFRTFPNQTILELRVDDEANTTFGDDFGMTSVGLRECVPLLGVAKQGGNVIDNGNGTFTIPYTIAVRNFAPAGNSQYNLSNVQITEDLTTAFTGATITAITNRQSPVLVVNPNFNGSTDQSLLLPGSVLPAGTTTTVTFSVTIAPGTAANGNGPFTNTAIATGITNGGTRVSDRSNSGTNPDPDGDGNPGNNNTATQITIAPGQPPAVGAPRLRMVKRVTNIVRNGAALSTLSFNQFFDAPGSEDNAPGWGRLPQGAPVGVFTIGTDTRLESGDEVEYTLYFLSDGSGPAIAVNLCDAIPSRTQFVQGSLQLQRGTASPLPSGGYFPPLTPLPSNNACTDQTNANGSILFSLGDVPSTAGENVGYARFRVRID